MKADAGPDPEVVAWVGALVTQVNAILDDFIAEEPDLRAGLTVIRLTDEHRERLLNDLVNRRTKPSWTLPWARFVHRTFAGAIWPDERFVCLALHRMDHTRVSFEVVVRAMRLLGVEVVEHGSIGARLRQVADTVRKQTGKLDLIGVAAVFDALGYPRTTTLLTWADRYRFADDWAASDVLPLFVAQADLLARLISKPGDHGWSHERERLFLAASMIPDPPVSLVDTLFALAVGTAKTDRACAQRVLADHPETPDRLTAALADKRFTVRSQAAEWIARLRIQAAVDGLGAALARERHDGARAALIGALESLGHWQQTDARHELERPVHRDLGRPLATAVAWFPLHRLPLVHWADDGEQVPGVVLRWLVDQVGRVKNPEPDALLRAYVRAFEPADRAALGAAVLAAWIAEDLGNREPDDPRPVEYDGWGHPKFSAIAAKGLLAVPACCGGTTVVALARDYILTHYGLRAAQGEALIAMLAWTGEPEAIQFLLHLRRRFRTEGFQKEAGAQLEALAARSGWSAEDLGDRTIPFAGLEDDGTLRLSYGRRTIVATLGPDLKLGLLRDDQGLPLAALPNAGQSDDAAAVAEAKRTFVARSKELKAIVVAQRARLVEAMCVGRTWRFGDWSLYLVGHPVGRRLVERLVWLKDGGTTDGGLSFALRSDGSLRTASSRCSSSSGSGRSGRITSGSRRIGRTTRCWRTSPACGRPSSP